jgi:hypothetical protein
MTSMIGSRVKTWIVAVFADVDSRSVLAVIVAKLAHRFWRGFRSA